MNRQSYNAIATAWDASRCSFYGREREYVDTLLEGLPVPSEILDLGCGTGRPIDEYIVSKGHRVTGVDQAEALLDLARSRYPTATWINDTIESFAAAEPVHAIVCWDALFHISRAEHERILTRFARMLLPGGRMMLTVGGSDHPAFTDAMHGRMFFYDSHPPDKVLSILASLGFQLIVSEFMNVPTSGRDKGRYAIVSRMA